MHAQVRVGESINPILGFKVLYDSVRLKMKMNRQWFWHNLPYLMWLWGVVDPVSITAGRVTQRCNAIHLVPREPQPHASAMINSNTCEAPQLQCIHDEKVEGLES